MVDYYKRSATLSEHPRILQAARMAPCDEYGADALVLFDEVLAANRLGDHDGVLPPCAAALEYLGRRLLRLRWDLARVGLAYQALVQVGLVQPAEDGSLEIPSWGDKWRQARSDAERARASRERARQQTERADNLSRMPRDGQRDSHRDAGHSRSPNTTIAPSRRVRTAVRDTVTPNQSVSQSINQSSIHPSRSTFPEPPEELAEVGGWKDAPSQQAGLPGSAVASSGDVHQTKPTTTPQSPVSNRNSPGDGHSGASPTGSPSATGRCNGPQASPRVAPSAEPIGAPSTSPPESSVRPLPFVRPAVDSVHSSEDPMLAKLRANSIGLGEPVSAQLIRAQALQHAGLTVSDLDTLDAQARKESNQQDHRGLLSYWLSDPTGLAQAALSRARERALAEKNAAVRSSTELTASQRRRPDSETIIRARLSDRMLTQDWIEAVAAEQRAPVEQVLAIAKTMGFVPRSEPGPSPS